MAQTIIGVQQQCGDEGYIYASYGHPKYLHHAIASIISLRRFDQDRPVAIACTPDHIALLEQTGIGRYVDYVTELSSEHCSIVGFKHHLEKFMFFKKNIFLDSDIIWCKSPNRLWQSLSVYDFTITGNYIADVYFGAPKGIQILSHILLNKRSRTLKKFGLTYLPRVQSGVVYAKDEALTALICDSARSMLSRIGETHFQSRLNEKGRTEESCEWSLAMSMSQHQVAIYPWLQGHDSPQLDFISTFTQFGDKITDVKCKFYFDPFVYSLRGIKNFRIQQMLIKFFSLFAGKSDYTWVTPYCLHFGWLHQKEPFLTYAEETWQELLLTAHNHNH